MKHYEISQGIVMNQLFKKSAYINIKKGCHVDIIFCFLNLKIKRDFERNATRPIIKNIFLKHSKSFKKYLRMIYMKNC